MINRRRYALEAAASVLTRLDIDEEQPVDVFEAVRRLGLWLTFHRLDRLLGTFLPVAAGGVIITTERPTAVQRYTAAHEIGHAAMDRAVALDDAEFIFSSSAPERERLAQLFAAYFIMPPPLVYRTAASHGITRHHVTPVHAYLLARDMRVSYEAAVRQLTNLDYVTAQARDRLLRIPPLTIKEHVAHGLRPANGYGNVWTIDEGSDGKMLEVDQDDAVVLALPESQSTGYTWLTKEEVAAASERVRAASGTLRRVGPDVPPEPGAAAGPGPMSTRETPRLSEARVLDRGGARYEVPGSRPGGSVAAAMDTASSRRNLRRAVRRGLVPEEVRVGATGRRFLALDATRGGSEIYELFYASRYDPDRPPAATFTLRAAVRPSPEIENRRRLLTVLADEPWPQ